MTLPVSAARLAIASVVVGFGWFQSATEVSAQAPPRVDRVQIDHVVPGRAGEQAVEISLRVLSADGEPVEDLRSVDLRVWQSDAPVEASELTLTPLASAGRALAGVMVLDVSRGVTGGAHTRNIQTALNFVERAGQDEVVAVLAVSDTVDVIVSFGTLPRAARQRLESLDIDAFAAAPMLYDAAISAVGLVRAQLSGEGRGFVVVVSDGPDGGSSRGVERAIDVSGGTEGEPLIPVFAVATSAASAEGVASLRRLAEGTGAGFQRTEAGSTVNSSVNAIWRQMLRGYLLRFPAQMDGRMHRVDVDVEGHMASVKVAFPEIRSSLWPRLALAVGAIVLLVGASFAFVAIRRAQPARLVIFTGAEAGSVVRLPIGQYSIGSLPDNDVILQSPGVSRHHAELVVEESRVVLRDLQSKNGTRVNGVIRESSPLLPGDRIEFAEIRMVYERGKKAKSRKTSER